MTHYDTYNQPKRSIMICKTDKWNIIIHYLIQAAYIYKEWSIWSYKSTTNDRTFAPLV